MCDHNNFVANVNIGRLTEDDKLTIKGFCADLTIFCKECGQDFEFIGVESGISSFGVMCSIDRRELRIPIKPSTGQIVFESKGHLN